MAQSQKGSQSHAKEVQMDFLGIDRVVFGATDLGQANDFFTQWGLKRTRKTLKTLVFETGNGNQVVVKREDDRSLPAKMAAHQEFREVIFGLSKQSDFDTIHQNLSTDRLVEIDEEGIMHTVDDSGIHIGFRWVRDHKKERPRDTLWNSPGNKKRVDSISNVYSQAHPFKMGHIVFFVPDTKVAENFYRQRLGFWLSDRYVGGAGVFLRWAKKSEHHNLFFVKSRTDSLALHHIAFEVDSIHEVFGGGVAFSKKGWPTEVGPGRHPISSAYFWYFKNPLGGAVEYFCDADFVTENWKPHQYRVNRFSEWHLIDGIEVKDDGKLRPSLKGAKEIDQQKKNAMAAPVKAST
ncbi:MAG: VOC family protein [Betaproteobacteria bacterium]